MTVEEATRARDVRVGDRIEHPGDGVHPPGVGDGWVVRVRRWRGPERSYVRVWVLEDADGRTRMNTYGLADPLWGAGRVVARAAT